MKLLILSVVIVVTFAEPFHITAKETNLIKIATLAPDGSTWMQVLRSYNKTIIAESGGSLRFRIFPGGVSGTEKDMLRKMNYGQLDAVALTGAGLGQVVPAERILDSILLFESTDEIDVVYQQFTPEIEKLFYKEGYVVLGWAEVGPIYLFSTTPVESVASLRKLRWWTWEGDPLAKSIFRALNVSPIPLHVADVMTALQTGVIDGVYSSALAMLALQWFSRVNFRLDLPLGTASGALLISRRRFENLEPELQEILSRNGRDFMSKLQLLSRSDNLAALATMNRRGVKTVRPSDDDKKEIIEKGSVARRSLVPQLYSEELLNRVESTVYETREISSTTQ